MPNASDAVLLLGTHEFAPHSGHKYPSGENHAFFLDAAVRTRLASALIRRDRSRDRRMEPLKKFESLRIWKSGPRNILTSSALSQCRNSRFTNPIGSTGSVDAAIQRQIAYFFTSAGSLAGHCMRSRRPKGIDGVVQTARDDAQKGNQTPFGTGQPICCGPAKTRSPKSSPRPYPELDARHVPNVYRPR